MLVDSHCHLNFVDFPKEELSSIVQNAIDAGVGYMLSIATNFTELPEVVDCVETFPSVFGAMGLHPEYAGENGEPLPTVNQLCDALSHPKFIGVGECGFNFTPDTMASEELQEELFKRHINVAREMELPLVVHTRNADKNTIEVLTREMKRGKFTGVIHCFTGEKELADVALNIGFYISASGIVTFGKNADNLRAIFKEIPVDRLLVETDAPFLAPTPMRGKRNEPAFVKHTAERMSLIKEIDFEEFAKITTDNFFTLFTKAKRI